MSDTDKTVAVLGAGSFGTALANLIGQNQYRCRLWMRDAEKAALTQQTRINQVYMPDLVLSENVSVSADLAWVVREADLILVTLPSKAFRDTAQRIAAWIKPDAIVISGTKGVEPDTSCRMSEVLEEELPQTVRIGVLSGPNLAREIAAGQITGSVVASKHPDVCRTVQNVLACGHFRIYSNDDPVGVELAGTLKNIYAILAGIAAASGAGANTFGMLITRSLAEMSRFAVAQGANPNTFLGLSGVGDLITTCTSPLSRNYKVGQAIASGANLEEALASVAETAEGVNTVAVIVKQAQALKVSMPLAEGLYRILYESESVIEVVNDLMHREQRQESE